MQPYHIECSILPKGWIEIPHSLTAVVVISFVLWKKLVDKISHAKWNDTNNNITALDSNTNEYVSNIKMTPKL